MVTADRTADRSADVLPLVGFLGGSRPIFPYELVARIRSRAAEVCREFTEAASSARVLVSAGVAAPSGCSAGPRATLEMPAQVRLQRLGQHVQPAAAAAAAAASARPKWIIDCHTHFWCATPQSVCSASCSPSRVAWSDPPVLSRLGTLVAARRTPGQRETARSPW